MIAIKRSVSVRLEVETRGDKHTEGNVRCNIAWDGKRLRIAVGHRVNVTGWSAEMRRCKPKTYHGKYKTPASVINKDIEEFELLVEGVFRDFEMHDVIPTISQFREAFDVLRKPESEKPTDKSIFPIYNMYISEGVNLGRWREGTLKKIKTVKNHLYDISPNLTFEDLERDGMNLIITNLSKRQDKKKEVGLTNPTIKKEIVVVKSFVRWAIEKGYCESSKFVEQRSRLKSAKKIVVFLDWDELMTVYNYDFGNNWSLAQVRDVFCFCCFTSLRYSDVKHLRKDDIVNDAIKVTTIKTDANLVIELNKYSRAILDKYKDVELPNGMALPVISNQCMNDRLKIIGEMCELDTPITIATYKGTERIETTYKKWELLSTHAGRRTFISNALMLGVSPEIVMKWTGHSDYKAMKPYIDIVDEVKRKAMSVFDK